MSKDEKQNGNEKEELPTPPAGEKWYFVVAAYIPDVRTKLQGEKVRKKRKDSTFTRILKKAIGRYYNVVTPNGPRYVYVISESNLNYVKTALEKKGISYEVLPYSSTDFPYSPKPKPPAIQQSESLNSALFQTPKEKTYGKYPDIQSQRPDGTFRADAYSDQEIGKMIELFNTMPDLDVDTLGRIWSTMFKKRGYTVHIHLRRLLQSKGFLLYRNPQTASINRKPKDTTTKEESVAKPDVETPPEPTPEPKPIVEATPTIMTALQQVAAVIVAKEEFDKEFDKAFEKFRDAIAKVGPLIVPNSLGVPETNPNPELDSQTVQVKLEDIKDSDTESLNKLTEAEREQRAINIISTQSLKKNGRLRKNGFAPVEIKRMIKLYKDATPCTLTKLDRSKLSEIVEQWAREFPATHGGKGKSGYYLVVLLQKHHGVRIIKKRHCDSKDQKAKHPPLENFKK